MFVCCYIGQVGACVSERVANNDHAPVSFQVRAKEIENFSDCTYWSLHRCRTPASRTSFFRFQQALGHSNLFCKRIYWIGSLPGVEASLRLLHITFSMKMPSNYSTGSTHIQLAPTQGALKVNPARIRKKITRSLKRSTTTRPYRSYANTHPSRCASSKQAIMFQI